MAVYQNLSNSSYSTSDSYLMAVILYQ